MSEPVAAQLNLPATLHYSIPDPTPPSAVPADSEMPPPIAETYDYSALTTTSGASYAAVADGGLYQAKARFTCVGNDTVAWIDQIRGPGIKPFGHLHGPFFGGTSVDANITNWTALRTAAHAKSDAGLLASTCPGDLINGSIYWQPAFVFPNAMGDGVTRVKKPNLITLYYVIDHPEDAATTQPIRPGLKLVFGVNMDDPDMTAFRARVAAANTATPSLQMPDPGPVRGEWLCDGDNTVYSALTNLDGTPGFQCAAGNTLYARVLSNVCWNGHLTSSDGYSNTIPKVHSNNDGKDHCPLEYPWHLPQVETNFRYTHQGTADWSRGRLSCDDMMAAKLGHPIANGSCLHTDYVSGWDQRFLDDFQCGLGIQVVGRTCTPHIMDYSTTGPRGDGGPVLRLLSDSVVPHSGGKLLVNIGNNFTGALASDWLAVPPQGLKGPATLHGHGAM